MPKKGKRKKGKRRKKGKKKKKEVPQPPPLHELTKLYNDLIDCLEDFRAARNKARKKRVEAWYMTREMMALSHDNAVYHKYLKEKMDEAENLFSELTKQLNDEREELEKIIKKRMEEMDRIIASHKARSAKAEQSLIELKTKLQEFEPLMRELGALMAKLKELQALIPIYELEANIKTRHLKNQYLNERAKLHNHLENELYLLILTCRSHLMPILSDHMTSMELENRCNRWELGNLDLENFRLSRARENLLDRRNRLNMEREYLNIDWAFNKLAQVELRNKHRRSIMRAKRAPPEKEDDCELAIAFRAYLSKKLGDIEKAKEREAKLKARKEARLKKIQREEEKKKREEILQKKRAKALAEKERKAKGLPPLESETEEEEDDEYEDEWGELEYYEDDEGNWVIATPSRMVQHKAILENKALADVEQQVEDIKQMISGDEDESSSGSGSYSSGSESEGSLGSLSDLSDEEDDDERSKTKKKGSDGFGDFDDDFDDNFDTY